jgi:hypothetical protein
MVCWVCVVWCECVCRVFVVCGVFVGVVSSVCGVWCLCCGVCVCGVFVCAVCVVSCMCVV